MTSTVTELIRETIRSTSASTIAATFGIITIVLLVVLLVQKEFRRGWGGSRSSAWAQTLNIAIVPLFMAFLVIIAVRFLRLGS